MLTPHALLRALRPCARCSYNKATGGKWGLRGLKLYMAARHGRKAADKAFGECQEIVIRSLLAVAGEYHLFCSVSFFLLVVAHYHLLLHFIFCVLLAHFVSLPFSPSQM